jgi:phage terminase large subunit-like protein
MQADIEHLRFEMQSRNYRFDVLELGGSIPKKDRIGKLVPLFEQGRMYLPVRSPFRDQEGTWRDLTKEFIADEYMAFPVSTHDDMLDCMARILDPVMGAEFPSLSPVEGDSFNLGNMEYDLYE